MSCSQRGFDRILRLRVPTRQQPIVGHRTRAWIPDGRADCPPAGPGPDPTRRFLRRVGVDASPASCSHSGGSEGTRNPRPGFSSRRPSHPPIGASPPAGWDRGRLSGPRSCRLLHRRGLVQEAGSRGNWPHWPRSAVSQSRHSTFAASATRGNWAARGHRSPIDFAKQFGWSRSPSHAGRG